MLIMWLFAHKSLPNLLFGVLCLPGDQSHPFAQPTINPLACCICWAGLLGRVVFGTRDLGTFLGTKARILGLTIIIWIVCMYVSIHVGFLVAQLVKNLPAIQETLV